MNVMSTVSQQHAISPLWSDIDYDNQAIILTPSHSFNLQREQLLPPMTSI